MPVGFKKVLRMGAEHQDGLQTGGKKILKTLNNG
jgi:hypothetical protein